LFDEHSHCVRGYTQKILDYSPVQIRASIDRSGHLTERFTLYIKQ
jgi:hypothetical protein